MLLVFLVAMVSNRLNCARDRDMTRNSAGAAAQEAGLTFQIDTHHLPCRSAHKPHNQQTARASRSKPQRRRLDALVASGTVACIAYINLLPSLDHLTNRSADLEIRDPTLLQHVQPLCQQEQKLFVINRRFRPLR